MVLYDEQVEDPILSMSPYQAGKEKNKLSNRMKKIEESSKKLEDHLLQLNNDFVNPEIASDFKKLMDIQADMETTQINIDKYAEEWLEISEKLEKLESVLAKENKESNIEKTDTTQSE